MNHRADAPNEILMFSLMFPGTLWETKQGLLDTLQWAHGHPCHGGHSAFTWSIWGKKHSPVHAPCWVRPHQPRAPINAALCCLLLHALAWAPGGLALLSNQVTHPPTVCTVTAGDDEQVLEMDSCDGCTTLGVYSISLNCP